MNKKLSAIIILSLVFTLSLMGCKKKEEKVESKVKQEKQIEEVKKTEEGKLDEEEKEKDVEEQVAREIDLKKALGLSSDQLMDIKMDGLEEKNEDGKIRSLNYVEDYFGFKNIDTTYYFSDVADEVSAIGLHFTSDVDTMELVENMKKELGEASSEETDGEASKYSIEWIDKDGVYYTLMDFGEFKEFTVMKY